MNKYIVGTMVFCLFLLGVQPGMAKNTMSSLENKVSSSVAQQRAKGQQWGEVEDQVVMLIKQQNVKKVKKALKAGGVRINAQDANGTTLLMHAVTNWDSSGAGKVEIVQALLGAGADFRLKDKAGMTAFARALRAPNNGEIVDLLLQLSPVPSRSALDYAVKNHYTQAVSYMAGYDNGAYGQKALHSAVKRGAAQTVRALIQAGVNDRTSATEAPFLSYDLFITAVRQSDVPTYQALVEESAAANMEQDIFAPLFETPLGATKKDEQVRLRMLEIAVKYANPNKLPKALLNICATKVTEGPSRFIMEGVELLLQQKVYPNFISWIDNKSACAVTPYEMCLVRDQARAAELIRQAGGKTADSVDPKAQSTLVSHFCREQLHEAYLSDFGYR